MLTDLFEPRKEKIIIEIDPETSDYSMELEFISLSNLRGVLADILKRIDDNTLIKEPGIQTTVD